MAQFPKPTQRGPVPEWLEKALGSQLQEAVRDLTFVDAFSGPAAGLTTAVNRVQGQGVNAAESYDLQTSNENDVLSWQGFLKLTAMILRVQPGWISKVTW